jgi:mannose-6-phosphate isomerase
MVRPLVLGSNRPPRFYRGGAGIDAFRGESAGPDRPEDWVASTTSLFGQQHEGLTTVGGRALRDLIREDPDAWLGRDHTARLGSDPGLLVKLLSAGERLLIHAHPSRDFSERWLASRWGKTEAWIILNTGPSGQVWLGWQEEMHADELRHAVDVQESDRLLPMMNRLPVHQGDAILVPAGTPHAIGPDMLILELQEPTDFSILLEWRGFQVDGARDGHLGLGFDVALGAVEKVATTPTRLDALVRRTDARAQAPADARAGADLEPPTSLLPPTADPFFRAEPVTQRSASMPAGFGVLVVTSGDGWLDTVAGDPIAVRGGMTLVIPAAAGPWRLRGKVTAIHSRPGVGA